MSLKPDRREPFLLYVEVPRRLGYDRWSTGADEMFQFDRPVPIPEIGDLVVAWDDCAYPLLRRSFSYGDNLVVVALYTDQPIPADGGAA